MQALSLLLTKQSLMVLIAGAEVNVDPTQTYTAAAAHGTLTLTPGGDDTIIPVATTTLAGLMSAEDKNAFDSLVASPGGVVSITAGDGIVVTGMLVLPLSVQTLALQFLTALLLR